LGTAAAAGPNVPQFTAGNEGPGAGQITFGIVWAQLKTQLRCIIRTARPGAIQPPRP
jgi:hypothetical protein